MNTKKIQSFFKEFFKTDVLFTFLFNVFFIILCLLSFSQFPNCFIEAGFGENPELCSRAGGFFTFYFVVFIFFVKAVIKNIILIYCFIKKLVKKVVKK